MKCNFLMTCLVVAGLYSCQKDARVNEQISERPGSSTKPINPEDSRQVQTRSDIGSDRVCGPEFTQLALTGKTFLEATTVVGGWHNEYLDKFFSDMCQVKMKPAAKGFKEFLHTKTGEIFSGRGITITDLPLTKKFNFLSPTVNIDESTTYSSEAKDILKTLLYITQTKCVAGDETVAMDFDELKNRALNLPDQKEALSAGIAVSVAINSYSYWKANASKWFEYSGNSVSAKNKFGVGQFVVADVSGAVQGALCGVGGGVAGAVAGAIVGSAASSLLNCFSQAVGWLISWW